MEEGTSFLRECRDLVDISPWAEQIFYEIIYA